MPERKLTVWIDESAYWNLKQLAIDESRAAKRPVSMSEIVRSAIDRQLLDAREHIPLKRPRQS
jgi:hypothetical protein